jgi:manganese/zinc/iron transport system permease protein
MFRRFSLVSFNDEFASAVGLRVWALDLLMLGLVVVVTIFGLQSVGIVLVVALMIVPPVTARLWTDRLGRMVVVSACVGGVSGFLGAVLSASVDRLATGPVIVLCAGGMFVVSLLCAPRRGVLAGAVRGVRLRARIRSDHLLLAMRELEGGGTGGGYVARGVRDAVGLLRLARRGLATRVEGAGWRLTEAGRAAGELAARQRRLWEMYLVTYADVAPSHLDVAVDRIEHVLDPATLAALEVAISAAQDAGVGVPGGPGGAGGLDAAGRGVDV